MTKRVAILLFCALAAAAARAKDDGSQLASPFRVNYLGYFQHGPKIALYLSAEGGALAWSLKDATGTIVASGTSRDHVTGDFASGDSFFRIDFSFFGGPGAGFRLSANGKDSEAFDVSVANPYGRLAEESFDYFKDHRAPDTVFEKFLHDWTTGRIEGPFWYDAGDKGSYPTNTAMAAWLLMNLYERYPESNASLGKTTLYEEVKIGTALMHQLILPGQKLAVAKLHTNVPAWGPCPPHEHGAVRVEDGDEGHLRDGAVARPARAGPRGGEGSRRKRERPSRSRRPPSRTRGPSPRSAATSRTSAARAASIRTTTSTRSGESRPRTASRATPAGTTSRTTRTRPWSRCSSPAALSGTRVPPLSRVR